MASSARVSLARSSPAQNEKHLPWLDRRENSAVNSRPPTPGHEDQNAGRAIWVDGHVPVGEVCGFALARAHARSGESSLNSGYLGRRDTLVKAIAAFSIACVITAKRTTQFSPEGRAQRGPGCDRSRMTAGSQFASECLPSSCSETNPYRAKV
jgi:hypothetical protein